MENVILITVGGVLLLYFFSTMNVYKSLYKKVGEEKSLLQDQVRDLENLIDKYNMQIKGSSSVLSDAQDNLKVARDDLQRLKVENNDLKHKLDVLQKRADDLYAQLNAMV